MSIHFTKMQSGGNDYVYIETLSQRVEHPERLAVHMSDRHFGVGADGLITIGTSDRADFRMRVFDPDGTEAEMCGNGLRSVAKFVYDKGFTQKTAFTVETLGGVQRVWLTIDESNAKEVKNITADIGEPIWEPERIPACSAMPIIEKPIRAEGRLFFLTALSLGNPHGVCFLESEEDLEALKLPRFGAILENHTLFPKRANIEFCKVLDRSTLSMRSWERGTGETLSCATGCAACVAVGVRLGMCERQVRVLQRGGATEIEWADGRLRMTAPSYTVFEGVWDTREGDER